MYYSLDDFVEHGPFVLQDEDRFHSILHSGEVPWADGRTMILVICLLTPLLAIRGCERCIGSPRMAEQPRSCLLCFQLAAADGIDRLSSLIKEGPPISPQSSGAESHGVSRGGTTRARVQNRERV
jgi:hypothetical protein